MSNGAKIPSRYRQKAREEKRDHDIRLAHRLGKTSRHEENPEGSRRWIETGRWEETN